ncbi:hypothetical protein P618_200013 [Holospora obtusa F1]|uniref:Uncharacterized protein n=1 Tax=Holospora obtusa F1 TaxID=1399147 RepID=W6TEL8_HOLOB|nr:hypothetical protein [Holospora obtusa]ETZ07773.1 hypothetical protein P618_200013 [Holospora obtusa F1]
MSVLPLNAGALLKIPRYSKQTIFSTQTVVRDVSWGMEEVLSVPLHCFKACQIPCEG